MNNRYTLWQLLTRYRVVIPIIQRDYAQGRPGKEHIREKFLSQLKAALNDTGNESGEMDFVYGSCDNGTFYPLDGQQRLTTLWLLHWYVAFKAGKLEAVKDTLKKFSYEVRSSSREFCANLCELSDAQQQLDQEPVEYIRCQTWFYSAWEQDPTVRSMLTMLREIEKQFNELNFNDIWGKLQAENCPLTFSYLDDLKQTDDLYIKMNARGRQLTDFENFKADFAEYIQKEGAGQDYLNLIDNAWTDIFWANSKVEGHIDEIFFAFFNRYFCNKFIISCDKSNKEMEASDEWRLYGNESDDSTIPFEKFDIYKSILSKDKGILPGLKEIFDRLKPISSLAVSINDKVKACLPKWNRATWLNDFTFIPEYELDNGEPETIINHSQRKIFKIKSLTQSQRILFFAICQYLEKNNFEENSFRDWLRVVCNLIENPEVDTVSSMIGRIKLIHKLSGYSHNIIREMAEDNFIIDSDAARDQLNEEIVKAKKIVEDSAWKKKIIKAENTAFFNGAIRFLYGGSDQADWDNFDNNCKNAEEYFNENGVQEPYNTDAKLLRRFMSHFNKWDQWWEIAFCDTAKEWKKRLLAPELQLPVARLLQKNDIQTFDFESFSCDYSKEDEEYAEQKIYTIGLLIKTAVLNDVLASGTNSEFALRFKETWKWDSGKKGVYSIAPKGQGNHNQKKYLVLHRRRLELLSELAGKITIEDSKGMYIPGQDIIFKYKNKNFIWYIAPDEYDVYIMNDNYDKGEGFDVNNCDSEYFLTKLNGVILNQMQCEKQ